MSRKRIAIFEDDPVNRFTFQHILKAHEKVETFIFENPETGINMAGQMHFDVIFIELHFWRDFGGISILEKIKELSLGNTTFIAMTSLLQEGDLELTLASGFNLCVEKPVVFSELGISMVS